MNTQTTKKSLKLNFFDILLIVLAVLVVVVAAVLFLPSGDADNTEKNPVEFTVLVKNLPEQMKIRTKKGDPVFDTIWLGEIGKITAVKREKATYDAFNYEKETTVQGQYADIYNVAFTIRADAVKTDSAFTVGNVRIAVGSEVHFRTQNFVGYGYITDVNDLLSGSN